MPVVIGEGIGIADLVVFVCLLAIVLLLWSLLAIRQPISGVPIVGGPGVNLIDGMRKTATDWANSLLGFFDAQQLAASQLWSRFILQVVNPAFAGWQQTIVGLVLWERDLVARVIPALQSGLLATQTIVVQQLVPQVARLAAQQVQDEQYVQAVVVAQLATQAAAIASAERELIAQGGRLSILERELLNISATVGSLAAYESLLRNLAAFESVTQGGVSTLQQELTVQGQGIQSLTQDLQKLLALLGLAALGAVAIGNLIRIAKDPCSPCPGNNLLDMELRLESLEFFGET